MGWKENFGSQLQREREAQRISLRELGKAIGASPETVRQYELASRLPDADKLAKIAVALGIKEFKLGELKFVVNERTAPVVGGEQLNLDFRRLHKFKCSGQN